MAETDPEIRASRRRGQDREKRPAEEREAAEKQGCQHERQDRRNNDEDQKNLQNLDLEEQRGADEGEEAQLQEARGGQVAHEAV